MAQQTETMTFGDSYRALADIVDQVPSLIMAKAYPNVGVVSLFNVTSAEAVVSLAGVIGAEVQTSDPSRGSLHTYFQVTVGRVALRVVHIAEEPPRELHRPVEVTETIAGVES